MKKKLTAVGLLMALSQSGNALNVNSRGDAVFIQDAISPAGVPAEINLVETAPNGASRLVPLEDAQGIQYQLEGRNLRISTAGAKGRYQAISIERNENGNRQSMRVSIGGGNSSSIVQSQSSSSSYRATPPPPPPTPVQRFQRPNAQPSADSPVKEGAYLSNQQIANEDFAGAKLGGMLVVNSRFTTDRFRDADLSGSSMTNTRFNHCDMKQADLSGSQLVNVRFEGSDLRSANFQGSNLVNVKFEGSDLSGAIWQDGQRCQPGSIGVCKL